MRLQWTLAVLRRTVAKQQPRREHLGADPATDPQPGLVAELEVQPAVHAAGRTRLAATVAVTGNHGTGPAGWPLGRTRIPDRAWLRAVSCDLGNFDIGTDLKVSNIWVFGARALTRGNGLADDV
jgi:hypothetical protein